MPVLPMILVRELNNRLKLMRFSDDLEDEIKAQLLQEIDEIDMVRSIASSLDNTLKPETENDKSIIDERDGVEIFNNILKELQIQTGKLQKAAGAKIRTKLHKSQAYISIKDNLMVSNSKSAVLKDLEVQIPTKSSLYRFTNEFKIPTTELNMTKDIEKGFPSSEDNKKLSNKYPQVSCHDPVTESYNMYNEDKLSRKLLNFEKLLNKLDKLIPRFQLDKLRDSFNSITSFKPLSKCFIKPGSSYFNMYIELTNDENKLLFKTRLKSQTTRSVTKILKNKKEAIVALKTNGSIRPSDNNLEPIHINIRKNIDELTIKDSGDGQEDSDTINFYTSKNDSLASLITTTHAPVLLDELLNIKIKQDDMAMHKLVISNQTIKAEDLASDLYHFHMYEIKNTGIKEINSCFSHAVELIASHNNISTFNKSFTFLKTLDLSYNSLKYISLGDQSNLSYLDISYNQVTDIGDVLTYSPELKVLKAKNNLISYVKFTSSNKHIQFLDLSNNGLEYIEGLEHLKELRYLNLAGNPNLILKQNFFLFPLLEEIFVELKNYYFNFDELILVSYNKNLNKFLDKQLEYSSRIKIVNKTINLEGFYDLVPCEKNWTLSALLADKVISYKNKNDYRTNNGIWKNNMNKDAYYGILSGVNKALRNTDINGLLKLLDTKINYENKVQNFERKMSKKLSQWVQKARLGKFTRLIDQLGIKVAFHELKTTVNILKEKEKIVCIQKWFRGYYTRKKLKSLLNVKLNDDIKTDDIESFDTDFMTLSKDLDDFESFYKTSTKFVEASEKPDESKVQRKANKNFVIKSKTRHKPTEIKENVNSNIILDQLVEEWGLKQNGTIQAFANKVKRDHKRKKNNNFRIVNVNL